MALIRASIHFGSDLLVNQDDSESTVSQKTEHDVSLFWASWTLILKRKFAFELEFLLLNAPPMKVLSLFCIVEAEMK